MPVTPPPASGGGGGGSVVFYDEGSAIGTGSILNFVGAGVTGTFSGGTAVATIAGGTAAGSIVFLDEGTVAGTATHFNVVGSSGTVAYSGGTATLTLSAGGGGLTQAYVGYNAVGGSWAAATPGRWIIKKVTLANACLVTDIEAHIKMVADVEGGQVYVAIWSDNAGAPQYLLCDAGTYANLVLEESSSGPRVARWYSVPVGRWLTAADYWIGVMLEDADVQIAYDGSGADRYFAPSTPGQLGDMPLWTVTTTTDRYSIRANTIR